MTHILILENKSLHPHRLRASSRRSGISFLYDFASTAADVPRLLLRHPSLLVASLEGLPRLPLARIAEIAREAHLPLVIVGGDTPAERAQLAGMRELSTIATCRRSRLAWLPMLLERALRNAAPVQPAQPCAPEQMREIQKLVSVGQLAGEIVHEINNPLEAVINLVYLVLSDASLPEELRHYLDDAQQELGRVGEITKQTLSFYRESQAPVRTLLSSLLDEVLTLYSRRLQEKKIHLIRCFEAEEPVLVFPGELRQVYSNLLANAIEATPPHGCISVRIHRSRRWKAGKAAPANGMRVLIADSGSGIPPHVRARLGQPFYTTKGQRGTGLGLWVSQTILARYGGEMQLRSSTGPVRKGTTFSIFVPLEAASRVLTISGPARAAQPAPLRPGMENLQLRANGA